MTHDEMRLIRGYRAAPPEIREAAQNILAPYLLQTTKTKQETKILVFKQREGREHAESRK